MGTEKIQNSNNFQNLVVTFDLWIIGKHWAMALSLPALSPLASRDSTALH